MYAIVKAREIPSNADANQRSAGVAHYTPSRRGWVSSLRRYRQVFSFDSRNNVAAVEPSAEAIAIFRFGRKARKKSASGLHHNKAALNKLARASRLF